LCETKHDKTTFTKQIYDLIETTGARFLKLKPQTLEWEVISPAAAREKIGHSLRFAGRPWKRNSNALTCAELAEKLSESKPAFLEGLKKSQSRFAASGAEIEGTSFSNAPAMLKRSKLALSSSAPNMGTSASYSNKRTKRESSMPSLLNHGQSFPGYSVAQNPPLQRTSESKNAASTPPNSNNFQRRFGSDSSQSRPCKNILAISLLKDFIKKDRASSTTSSLSKPCPRNTSRSSCFHEPNTFPFSTAAAAYNSIPTVSTHQEESSPLSFPVHLVAFNGNAGDDNKSPTPARVDTTSHTTLASQSPQTTCNPASDDADFDAEILSVLFN